LYENKHLIADIITFILILRTGILYMFCDAGFWGGGGGGPWGGFPGWFGGDDGWWDD